ncbi:hypothetical protein [Nocardia panacis]|uniref:hypothetical protein n=1 Tax=Nocardia panacis TaxID=2340916 RepID=UPI0011C37587|nr:hypothetical protein [Nocardia panacis]
MNDHDELDQVRREITQLGHKVREAATTAAALTEARTREAERAHTQAERTRDRAEQRAERAQRLAERAQRRLHAQWRAADRAAATDLAVELEATRSTHAAQEQLVGQWAWAQAHADENPETARELDARLLAETGIDPATLRNPFTTTEPTTDPTQPAPPIDLTTVDSEIGDEPTVLDGDALIRGLIQAAHPTGASKPATGQKISGVVEPDPGVSQDLAADAGLSA